MENDSGLEWLGENGMNAILFEQPMFAKAVMPDRITLASEGFGT
jgi:hypothetical protein